MSLARSELMRRVRRQDTQPERNVRRILFRNGFRFRLHRRDLPGSPDIVLPKYRVAIFVNGCFWHRHPDCLRASFPKTNKDFWKRKFEANVARDHEASRALERLVWRVITVWECELREEKNLERRLVTALGQVSS